MQVDQLPATSYALPRHSPLTHLGSTYIRGPERHCSHIFLSPAMLSPCVLVSLLAPRCTDCHNCFQLPTLEEHAPPTSYSAPERFGQLHLQTLTSVITSGPRRRSDVRHATIETTAIWIATSRCAVQVFWSSGVHHHLPLAVFNREEKIDRQGGERLLLVVYCGTSVHPPPARCLLVKPRRSR